MLQAAVGFVQLLRSHGLPVGLGQTADLCRALTLVDLLDREQVYAAARAVLLTRHSDQPLFDLLFARFWLRYEPPMSFQRAIDAPARSRSRGRPAPVEAGEGGVPGARLLLSGADEAAEAAGDEEAADPRTDRLAAYSVGEALRRKDFGDLSHEELAEVRRLIANLHWQTSLRRVRRYRRAAKGPRLDPRRALRDNLAHGGELLALPRRRRRAKPRQLVLICDISGSMARYTSMLLRFLHALRQGREGVETFVFGTRLTRITRQLRTRDTDRALAEVGGEVLDWGGGTRMGESLATFNRRWGRRVLGHDATVVLISDGWDRGEPAQLAREMAHLQRLSYRLIWLNPLLGLSGYQPLTRGMRAALPFIDDFLAAHNLASLEALAAFLRDLEDGRADRGRHGGAARFAVE